MNSAMALYSRIDDPLKAAKEIGIWLARSGLIGTNASAEAGAAIAFDAMSRGTPIFDIPLNYHLVSGKLAMKAESMLAGWHELGGKHRIIERSADACQIEFSIDDECETFATTWEEAQSEKWPYGKDGKSIKDTWKGPVGRADMLWARTVSRGVRKLRPQVVGGKYTPEEIADLAEYTEAVRPAERIPADIDAILKAAANGNGNSTTGVAKITKVSETVAAPAVEKPVAESTDGYATAAQSARIHDLFVQLEVPVEAQENALAKRGAAAVRSLTAEQAAELIASLEARLPAKEQPATSPVGEQSKLPDKITGCPTSAPCTPSQVEGIITVIKEIAETDPEFPDKYRARLAAMGKTRTADLSIKQADAVMAVLLTDNLRQFFDHSLEQLVADNATTTEPPPN